MISLLMDSDCLIKISKAGLKEYVADYCSIEIPQIVKMEVVDAGLEKNLPDAVLVEKNIQEKKVKIIQSKKNFKNGDQAVYELFDPKKYRFVATDDAKLIKFLRANNIPFVVPAMLFYLLYRKKLSSQRVALSQLGKLEPFISSEEYSSVRMLMEKKHETS